MLKRVDLYFYLLLPYTNVPTHLCFVFQQFNPAGGAGAVNAMHDAITLGNYINALPHHPTAEEVTEAFKAYREERIPWVQEAFDTSKIFRIMASKVG